MIERARPCVEEELRDKLKAAVQAMAPMLARVLRRRAAVEGREPSREEFEEAMSTVVKMTAAKGSGGGGGDDDDGDDDDDHDGGTKARTGAPAAAALDGLLRGKGCPTQLRKF